MPKHLIVMILCLFFSLNSHSQPITDIDNNVYNTIVIGGQKWMQANLKTIHFNNGDPIANITDNSQWWLLTTSAYCNFDNDTSYVPTYGRLYNGFVVADRRNVCPVGWHVPSEVEWRQLFSYLGGDSIAGGKLKEADTTHWAYPNIDATNLRGFTALPNGFRGTSSPTGCTGLTTAASFWGTNLYAAFLSFNNGYVDHAGGNANAGLGIRCLADAPNGIIDYGNFYDVKIFPNPAKGSIQIEMPKHKIDLIKIYDIRGTIVRSEKISSHAAQMDVADLTAGTYFVEVSLLDGQKAIRKICIAY